MSLGAVPRPGLVLARLVTVILFPAICLVIPHFVVQASTQTVGTTYGALSGRVTDESGGSLPGVAVTVSGASMGPRVTTTGTDGTYLVPALAPGAYRVAFEHRGFQPASSDVRVHSGVSATVDLALRVAAHAEAVTVEARPAAIDRHATAITESFTSEQLASLPGSRSLFAVLSSTPLVYVSRFEVGASEGDAGGLFGSYGTEGANRPTVEGISVAQILAFGFTLDYASFEEAAVSLAAHGPEWGAPGVHVRFVGKSGGNQYRGRVYGDLEQRGWQSRNIDEGLEGRSDNPGASPLSPDANRMWRSYEFNADVGGYLARDRAWWYASVRDQDVQRRRVNFPVKPVRTHLRNFTGKATLRAASHTIVGFAQAGRNHQPNRLDPFGPAGAGAVTAASAVRAAEEATSDLRVSGIIWKAEWNATLGERLFAEARVGQFDVGRRLAPNGAGPRFEDVETLEVRGAGRRAERRLGRNYLHASVSYFPDRWAGSHHVRGGGEIIETVTGDRLFAAFPGGVLHVTRGGEPSEVYLFLAPSESLSGLLAGGAYAADTWGIADRVTLNLGVRYDRYRVFLPAQAPPPGAQGQPAIFPAADAIVSWDLLAPRVGGAIDASGDGRTIVKASYGRYWAAPGDLGPNVNPNVAGWWRRHPWQDTNGSGKWEPGEEGLLTDSRGGAVSESIDPGLRAPWTDEATASVEHELPAAVAVRTGIVWRREAGGYERQNTARPFRAFTEPVVIADPGPDGLAGTADDGVALALYNLSATSAPPGGGPANVVRNVGGTPNRHVTWEVAAHRRIRGRWSLSAGFAHTWSLEHAVGYANQAIRQNTFVLTPNDLINTADGGRHRLTTWTAKAWGTVHAPWKIVVTPMLRHQSGQPFGRTITASMNYGVIRVLAEPVGRRRMDNMSLLDVRVEREFLRAGPGRFSIFLDACNLFNANYAEDANWASGSAFLQPLAVVSPRIARLGLRASF